MECEYLILEIVNERDMGELSTFNDISVQGCVWMLSALDCRSN
jgi:hypothetical protein